MFFFHFEISINALVSFVSFFQYLCYWSTGLIFFHVLRPSLDSDSDV